MKFFGLVSLLLVVGIGGWLATRSVSAPTTTNQSTSDEETVLDAARSAADALSGGGVVVYDGVTVSRNERILDLSGRGLDGSLKAEVRQLSQLEVLDISNNEFTGLAAEVGQLSKLTVLNLAYNPLTGLPNELGNLQQLETLDLRGTNYSAADLGVITERLPASTVILVD